AAKQVAEWLKDQVAAVAKQTQIQTSPTEKMLVAAAHLVERARVDEFRTRVTETRHQRPDLHFLLSGPWAPYSFANMDLEFKTHFGVS
ncbi:MAG TPA: GvpL/GvpF family gas vesicle protein, partial [Pyrinomonadaceae bacterium]